MKKIIVFATIIILCVSLVACKSDIDEPEMMQTEQEKNQAELVTVQTEQETETVKSGSLRWPNMGICELLPKPVSVEGEVNYDSAEEADIYVYETSQDDFYQYVMACQEMGFVVDYYSDDNSYEAKNADGYELWLYYDEEEQTMNIWIGVLEDEEEYNWAEPEPQNETSAAEETTEEEEVVEELVDGMRPEFKEAMDSYEDFFEDYCVFMEKYMEDPTDLTLIGEYAQFMTQYVETMQKMEAVDDGSLNDVELQYYAEVTGRIAEMLAEISA